MENDVVIVKEFWTSFLVKQDLKQACLLLDENILWLDDQAYFCHAEIGEYLSKFLIVHQLQGELVFSAVTAKTTSLGTNICLQINDTNNPLKIIWVNTFVGNHKLVNVTVKQVVNYNYAQLLEKVACGVCVYRIEQTGEVYLDYFNDMFCQICKCDGDEIVQSFKQDHFYGVCDEDRAKVKRAFNDVVVNGGCQEVIYQAKLIDDQLCWCNLHFNLVEDSYQKLVYATYFDVTKEIQNQQELNESRRLVEMACDNVGIWYWIYDWKNDIGYMSDKVIRDLGLPQKIEHFVSYWLKLGIIDQEYQEAYEAMVQAIVSGESQASAICRGYMPDGSSHWARFLMSSLDGTSKAIGTVGFIDEIKALEEKYELEKNRSQIEDDTLLAHASFDLTQNVTLAMERCVLLAPITENLSLNAFRDDTAKSILNQEQQAEFLKLFDKEYLITKFNQGIHEFTIEYRRTLANHKSIWVCSTFHMIRKPDSSSILLFYFCNDINKAKTLKMMVSASVNDNYDMLGCVDFYDDSVILLYGKGSYNNRDSQLTQADYWLTCTKFADDTIPPEEKAGYLAFVRPENVKQNLFEYGYCEYVFKIYDKNKAIRIKKIRYIKYEQEANICLFMQTDITELVREEQCKQDLLKQALNEAKRANSAKTSFLSQMSHEIRTPLNAILGMTKLAIDTKDTLEISDYLNKIDRSSHYLLDILNDILDMSRIESGKFELHPRWNGANSMLMNCIDMLSGEMARKKITFIGPERNYDEGFEFYVDELRMKQILMNLLNNAIKFTPVGGKITLSIEVTNLDENHRQDIVTISDTGCGMSEEFLTRIFNPFEQEQNFYSKTVQGTGLGLALVRQILDAMGGDIWVTSKLGQGSTFTYRIPYRYRKTKKENDAVCDLNLVDFKDKRVLLVDDHPLNREIAKKLLKKRGLLVEEAENGLEAVLMFEKNQYDCILMDIKMPVLGGLQATQKIRTCKMENALTIPIIAMTANAYEEDIQRSREAGMNDHLSKPIDPQLMFQTMAKYMFKKGG